MIHSSFWGVSLRGPSWSQGTPQSVPCRLSYTPELGMYHPRLLVCKEGPSHRQLSESLGPEPTGPATRREAPGAPWGCPVNELPHSPHQPIGHPVWGFLVCVCMFSGGEMGTCAEM